MNICEESYYYAGAFPPEHKITVLNTSVLTSAGKYELWDIGLEDARKAVTEYQDAYGYTYPVQIDSAIGHDSTSQILTELLGIDVPVNRQMFEQQPGQIALVFKLSGRPQEGKILSREEIEEIGYKFQILRRIN